MSKCKMLTAFVLVFLFQIVHGSWWSWDWSGPDLYCGEASCYDTLNVSQDCTRKEVKKAYYRLSLRFHPDRNSSEEAVGTFQRIATAYETLYSEETRSDYDEYLKHPEEYYKHAAVFYRRQWVGKRENVSTVFTGVFILVILFDHLYRVHRYGMLKEYFKGHPTVQQKVLELRAHSAEKAEEEDTPSPSPTRSGKNSSKRGKKRKGKKAELVISDEELHQVVELVGDHFQEPGWESLLVFRLHKIVHSVCQWIYWEIRWVMLFWVLGREYGAEERLYLTRSKLRSSIDKWTALEEDEQERLVSLELWKEENYQQFVLDERRAYHARRRKY